MNTIKHYRELSVYQNAMEAAMRIFGVLKELDDVCDHVLGQLVKMAAAPEKWIIPHPTP